jgi:hypothetical protein
MRYIKLSAVNFQDVAIIGKLVYDIINHKNCTSQYHTVPVCFWAVCDRLFALFKKCDRILIKLISSMELHLCLILAIA